MNRKLFYGALAACAALVFYFLFAIGRAPVNTSDPSAELPMQQQLLEQIAADYGYKPQSIEWKCQPSNGSLNCGSALTLPDAAWDGLPEEKRQLLINYAKTQGKTAIVVGKIKSPDTISLDREVWQKTP